MKKQITLDNMMNVIFLNEVVHPQKLQDEQLDVVKKSCTNADKCLKYQAKRCTGSMSDSLRLDCFNYSIDKSFIPASFMIPLPYEIGDYKLSHVTTHSDIMNTYPELNMKFYPERFKGKDGLFIEEKIDGTHCVWVDGKPLNNLQGVEEIVSFLDKELLND